MQIEGKTVLITGASSGVGAAIAKAMAEAGAAKILDIADTYWRDSPFERSFPQCYPA